MRKLSYQIAVSDHELRTCPLGINWFLDWTKRRLISELDRAAPHGPVELWTHRNGKLRLTTYEATTLWKEPVQ